MNIEKIIKFNPFDLNGKKKIKFLKIKLDHLHYITTKIAVNTKQ